MHLGVPASTAKDISHSGSGVGKWSTSTSSLSRNWSFQLLNVGWYQCLSFRRRIGLSSCRYGWQYGASGGFRFGVVGVSAWRLVRSGSYAYRHEAYQIRRAVQYEACRVGFVGISIIDQSEGQSRITILGVVLGQRLHQCSIAFPPL